MPIDVTERNGIAILTLAHGRANAMDTEMCRDLTGHLEHLRGSNARAVVLTATGSIFSAGVDLLRVIDEGPEYLHTFIPGLIAALEALFFFPKPVVAAVNGHAAAGGCILTGAADHRVMSDGGGRIGVTELLVGLPFPSIALEIMRFAAPGTFQEVVTTGTMYPAADALRKGLVDEIAPPGALMDRAAAKAEQLGSIPGPAYALTKAMMRDPVRRRLIETGPEFDARVTRIWTSPESIESIRSYVARTFRKS